MPNAIDTEKFKDSSMTKTISNLIKKYKPREEEKLEQNKIIATLEKEKENEKDPKTRGDIDYLIQVIRNFFANKFETAKAKQTALKRIQEVQVQNKIREIVANNQELQKQMQQLSEAMIGTQLTCQLIENYQLTAEAAKRFKNKQGGWVRSL